MTACKNNPFNLKRRAQIVRAIIVLLLVLFAAMNISAQTPPASVMPPDVQIIKNSWSKERINWEKNPFGTTEGFFEDVRNRASRERSSSSVMIERNRREQQKERPPAPPRYAFHYKLSIYNAGLKAIKEIDWDYVFTDSATGTESGRRQFTSVEKIAPGKRKELSILVSSPPTQTISVYALGKNERDGLGEQIIISRILYTDGTSWQAP
jgi:hypothetical protein